jgi:CBS domain-containing protein
MKVRDIMTAEPKCCEPDTNLATATELMWKADCGALPVVHDGKLAGIITDRDICIALGTRNRPAAEIAVRDVASRKLQTCTIDDDVSAAIATMRRAKVHRLPVVSGGGKLEGILALNDLVLAARRKRFDIDYDEVMNTLKAISEHRSTKPAEPEELKFSPISVAVA